jgi:hypothetical protein
VGVGVFGGSDARIVDSALVRNTEVGLDVNEPGGTCEVTGSFLGETALNPGGQMGWGIDVEDEASLHLKDTVLQRNWNTGLRLRNLATATVENVCIDQTRKAVASEFAGMGVLAVSASSVDFVNSVVDRTEGVGVVISESNSGVKASRMSRNSVALHVQDGSVLREVETLEVRGPLDVLITQDSRFEANGVKVGSGQMPLPVLPKANPSLAPR